MAGRRKVELVERVVDGSFRPVRHAELLRASTLPEEPPPPLNRGATRSSVWLWLRHLQEWYVWASDRGDLDEATSTLHDFALLVRFAHGGRRPSWLTPALERSFEDGLDGEISLLDLVIDGAFVARRHAELLLADPLLPPDAEIERLRSRRATVRAH